MSRFNTGNPLGSNDPRDLDDNAKNMDLAVNSDELRWSDRFGRDRKSFEGMEREFYADQASRENAFESAQHSREARFNDFIASSGYQFLGDYAAGLEFTEYNQLVRDENGEFWRLSGQIELPYTTTGGGIPEDDALVPAGDAVLRQDLSDPDKGAAMVAYGDANVKDALDKRTIFVGSVAELEDLPLLEGVNVYLTQDDRAGEFAGRSSDMSAEVAGDPFQGVYIAPSSDPTGASGAWERLSNRNRIDANWFGLSSAPDAAPVIEAALAHLTPGGVIAARSAAGEITLSSVLTIAKPCKIEFHGQVVNLPAAGRVSAGASDVTISGATFQSSRNDGVKNDVTLMRAEAGPDYSRWSFRECEFINVGLRFIRTGAVSNGGVVASGTNIADGAEVSRCVFRDYKANWVLNFNGAKNCWAKDCEFYNIGAGVSDDCVKIQGASEGIHISDFFMDGGTADAFDVFDSKRVTIRNCEVKNFAGMGVEIKGDSVDQISVSGCYIEGTGGDGIRSLSSGSIITNNRVYSVSGTGIRVGGINSESVRENCIVEGNHVTMSGTYGLSTAYLTKSVIRGNVSSLNSSYGLYIGSTTYSIIVDNIVSGTTQDGISLRVDASSVGCRIDNITDDENGQFEGALARIGTRNLIGGVGREAVEPGSEPSLLWPAGSIVRTAPDGNVWVKRTDANGWVKLTA